MRVLAILALLAGAAHADDRPWATGVPVEQQDEALAELRRGNDAFAESDYPTAAGHYRAALARWNHPAIHGNLAIALIHLDQVVDASREMDAAFAYGAAPFNPVVYGQLETNRKLLAGQISSLDLSGELDGVAVSLDGVPLDAPGRHVIRAGAHELVARRAGYLTFTTHLVAAAGTPVPVHVSLVPLADAGRLERPFDAWKPWVVVASGAALAVVGVGFELAARRNVREYELEIGRECPTGCVPSTLPQAVQDLESSARWQTRVGVAAIVVGGALLATGAVLVYANAPRRERVDESGRRIAIRPVVSPDAVGVTMTRAW